jgi:hypothetical protein
MQFITFQCFLYYQIGAKANNAHKGIRREQWTRHTKHGEQDWKDVREKRQGREENQRNGGKGGKQE